MDIDSEVQEYEAKISKMISEGGLGVSAYYEYDIPNKGSSKKELLAPQIHHQT